MNYGLNILAVKIRSMLLKTTLQVGNEKLFNVSKVSDEVNAISSKCHGECFLVISVF